MTVETIIAPAAWHDAIVHGDYSRWDYLGDNVEAERAEALEDTLNGPCVFAESIGDDVHPADTDTPDEPQQEFMRYAILNIVEPPDRPGTNWDPMVQARILAEEGVTYNPYRAGAFLIRSTGEPIHHAGRVVLARGAWALPADASLCPDPSSAGNMQEAEPCAS